MSETTVDRQTRQRTQVEPQSALGREDRDRMFELMCDHYVGVRQLQFDTDLAEKESIFTIRDPQGRIDGFSTLGRFTVAVGDDDSEVMFTGDTVLEPDLWGRSGWLRVWCKHIWDTSRSSRHPHVYYLLLTANHRSYRILPALFQGFYPSPWNVTPIETQHRLDAFARSKFGDEYNDQSGVIELRQPLLVRPERIESVSQGQDDELGTFFSARNPYFLQSQYLVCMAELSTTNLTDLGRRVFAVGQEPEIE